MNEILVLTKENKLKKLIEVPFHNKLQESTDKPIPVYRFIESQYVDAFFEKGQLMLSTFNRCKKLENSSRKDSKEGENILINRPGNSTIIAKVGVGINSLVLCTSLSKTNKLPNGTVYPSCIEIIDIKKFTSIITQELLKKGFIINSITIDKCIYNDRTIQSEINIDPILEQLKNNQELSPDQLSTLISQIGGEEMFFSKGNEYSHEQECRILWHLDSSLPDETVIIENPELIKCCKRIDF